MSQAFPHERNDEPVNIVRPRSAPAVRTDFAMRADAEGRGLERSQIPVISRVHNSGGNGKPGMPQQKPTPALVDCLRRTEIRTISPPPRADRCVATVGSAGYANLLDNLLGSLEANGGLDDVLLVVFVVDGDPECRRIAAHHGARVIVCRSLGPIGVGVKSVLYSVSQVVEAAEYLCLDADMLVLGDLRPLFTTLSTCAEETILVCREANRKGSGRLEHALERAYRGATGDIELLLGASNGEAAYQLIVNDGLFAGSRSALLALDATIRQMPHAPQWVDEAGAVCWRNQFIFNLALARLNCGVELKPEFNLQLHGQSVKCQWEQKGIHAFWGTTPVRVLHLSGHSKFQYPELCRVFTSAGRMRSEPDRYARPITPENSPDD